MAATRSSASSFAHEEGSAAALALAMAEGRTTRRAAGARLPGPDRGDRPERPAPAQRHRAQPRRDRDRQGARRRAQGRPRARAAARRAGAAQGQHRDRRPHEHDRRDRSRSTASGAARRAHRQAPARRRRGDPRQDQPERVGQHPLDAIGERLERARRPDAQSLRARPQHQRLELRLGGGGGGEPGAARRRHRDRRLDRLAGVDLRPGRPEADGRPAQPRRHRADLAQPGHAGPDGAQRRRRGAALRGDGRARRRRRRDLGGARRAGSGTRSRCPTMRCAAPASASPAPISPASTSSTG